VFNLEDEDWNCNGWMDERVTKSEGTALQREMQLQTKDRRKEGGYPCCFGMEDGGRRKEAKNGPRREGVTRSKQARAAS